MKVVVVGAGAAGLAATHCLRKRGVDVLALEARERAGGRTVSLSEDGFIIDLGAQFMSRDYSVTAGFLEEIGLSGGLVRSPVRIRMWNRGRLYPLGMGVDPRMLYGDLVYFLRCYGLQGLYGLSRIMACILRRWRQLGSQQELPLDLEGESFTSFVLNRSNREVLEGFLQPVISGLILEEPEKIGAVLGMVCMRMTTVGFATGLLTPRYGFGGIPDRLRQKYGESILVSTPVERIVIENGTVKGVVADGGLIDADAVICATTASGALGLMPDLPEELQAPLRSARYSACCHVVFGVEGHPFPEGEFARYLPRTSGSPISFIGSGRAKSPAMAPPGGDLVHCFTYGRHAVQLNGMTDGEVVRAVGEEARKYLPKLPRNPLFAKVCRFDEAVFMSPPGTLTRLMRTRERCPRVVRGLHLAGEYTGIGGVETAVQSGMEAADAATGRLYGESRSPVSAHLAS